MGTHKRFDEDDDEDVAETKATAFANNQSAVSKRVISKTGKRKLNHHPGSKSKTKSIRGQLRSVERLLKNRGAQLTPAARKAKQEELKELIRLRDEHDRREHEKTTATKYRMVKFFEKRKLQRRLDRITEHGDKPEDAEKKKQILRDLRYVNEYPKDKKYISLFPSGGHTDESRKRVEEMRKDIEGKVLHTGSGDPSGVEAVPAGRNDFDGEDDFFVNDDASD